MSIPRRDSDEPYRCPWTDRPHAFPVSKSRRSSPFLITLKNLWSRIVGGNQYIVMVDSGTGEPDYLAEYLIDRQGNTRLICACRGPI